MTVRLLKRILHDYLNATYAGGVLKSLSGFAMNAMALGESAMTNVRWNALESLRMEAGTPVHNLSTGYASASTRHFAHRQT